MEIQVILYIYIFFFYNYLFINGINKIEFKNIYNIVLIKERKKIKTKEIQ